MPKVSKVKIFIGVIEISGYYANIEQILSNSGFEARLVTTIPHSYDYGQKIANPIFARIANFAVQRSRNSSKLIKILYQFLYLFAATCLLFWSLPKFNVYIFSWGITFLPLNLDLFLLRLLGKRTIVFVGHGSEARPPYMSFHDSSKYLNKPDIYFARELLREIRAMKQKINRISTLASEVVGLRTTDHFLERPYFDLFDIGIPFVQSKVVESSNFENTGIFRILHLPSNPGPKGTEIIISIFSELQAEFPKVRFDIVTDINHKDALYEISKSDLVVDQLWSDIPMSAVAFEAANMGIPTIVAGNAWHLWGEILNKQPKLGLFFSTPENLKFQLSELITNRSLIRGAGFAFKEMMQEITDNERFARNIISIAVGKPITSKREFSKEHPYLWGAGCSKEMVFSQVKIISKNFGYRAIIPQKVGLIYNDLLKNIGQGDK